MQILQSWQILTRNVVELKAQFSSSFMAALDEQVNANGTLALITGANRGIGLEFVKQLLQREDYYIIACCRTPEKADVLQQLQSTNESKITIHKLEMTSDADIESISKSVGQKPIDLLILNAGVHGERVQTTKKSRALGTLTRSDMMNVYNVNVVGAMLLVQALYENIKRSSRKQIIGMSTGYASISDCGSNTAVPYRCSKAALGMALQAVAKDADNGGVHTMLIAPGWVKTDMGGKDARLTPTQSVQQMLTVIDDYEKRNNGGFYLYSGDEFPW